jgi:threonine/homoserine/homoserine lactone efflux protein
VVLGAFAVIIYLLRSGLAKQYEAFAAPLCAIACGGFLVWHAIHLFAEEDAIEEQTEAAADREAKLPAPPPGS